MIVMDTPNENTAERQQYQVICHSNNIDETSRQE